MKTPYVLKTSAVCKRYGQRYAVDHVDMAIQSGDIYGFIGRNGAGKTSLIRMLTGLARPTSGSIELFGRSDAKGIMIGRTRIGSVVEYPALYPGMTAVQNLQHHFLLLGGTNRGRITQVLELVGLTDTGMKKVKDFSLGMKQRLGLGLALLNDPDLIILDEPTNGLDPAGIAEIRETLRELAHTHKKAILISSHNLSELSQLATSFGIIESGKLIRQLTAQELADECQQYLYIEVNDAEKAAALLRNKLSVKDIRVGPGSKLRLLDTTLAPAKVNTTLVGGGFQVSQLTLKRINLEDYFLELTKSERKDEIHA